MKLKTILEGELTEGEELIPKDLLSTIKKTGFRPNEITKGTWGGPNTETVELKLKTSGTVGWLINPEKIEGLNRAFKKAGFLKMIIKTPGQGKYNLIMVGIKK